VVMDQGQLVESGTHQQLLQLNRHYARLHRMQFRDQLDDPLQVQRTEPADQAIE